MDAAGNRSAAASAMGSTLPASNAPILDLIAGHDWSRFSGATVVGNEVTIQGMGRGIIPLAKDPNKPVVKNPPINLQGPHLKLSGDFSVAYTLEAAASKNAVISLYGTLPVIQDEWRQEGKTVNIGAKNGKLNVEIYNGSSVTPAKATFAAPNTGTLTVKLMKKNGKFTFFANGASVGEMTDPGVFNEGKVYFGADADVGSSFVLKSLSAQKESSSAAINIVDYVVPIVAQSDVALRTLAAQKTPHLQIGTAVASNPLLSEPQYAQTLGREFGMVTPENVMKFQFIHPQRNMYAFAEADAVVDFAQKNHIQIHGHTLVWSEAVPRWVTDGRFNSAELKTIMEDHIKTVVGRYKGKIRDWDVINEPLNDDRFNVNLGLRESVWYKAMGEQFMDIALRAAHKADPDAKLYINEYGCEEDNEKADALYKIAKRLLDRGVPLHGIGFQLHEDIGKDSDGTYTPVTPAEFKANLKRFTDLGLEVRVSEIDVNIHGDVTNALINQQGDYYKSMLQLAAENNAFTAFSSWGFTDRYSSLAPADEYNVFGNGMMYDENYNPKPAFNKMRAYLQN